MCEPWMSLIFIPAVVEFDFNLWQKETGKCLDFDLGERVVSNKPLL